MNYNGSAVRRASYYGNPERKETLYFVFKQDKEWIGKAHTYLSDLLGKERVGDIDWGDPFPTIEVLATRDEMNLISVKLGLNHVWA